MLAGSWRMTLKRQDDEVAMRAMLMSETVLPIMFFFSWSCISWSVVWPGLCNN